MSTVTLLSYIIIYNLKSAVNTTPSWKDLHRYVIPQYAIRWKEMGIMLDLSLHELKIIELDRFSTMERCITMFMWWLERDLSASWGKLFAAIESPAVSSGIVPDKGEVKVIITLYIYSIVCIYSN